MMKEEVPQGKSDYPVDDLCTARGSDVATQVPSLYWYLLR